MTEAVQQQQPDAAQHAIEQMARSLLRAEADASEWRTFRCSPFDLRRQVIRQLSLMPPSTTKARAVERAEWIHAWVQRQCR